jgi:hypothetical protein
MSLRSHLLRSLFGVLAVVAGGLACPGRASATFVYAGSISTGPSNSTGQLISFTYSHGNTTDVFTSQYAGQLAASFVSAGRAGDFFAYCVDLNHSFRVPSNWSVNVNNTATIYGATVNNAGQIAYLIDTYGYQRLDADHSAGLQAAIWKVEYGTNFTLTSASAGVTNAYNTYLGSVTGANSGHVATALWLNPAGPTNLGDTPQGLVTVLASPAPSSIVMTGWSLAFLTGFFCWRRWSRPMAAVLAR